MSDFKLQMSRMSWQTTHGSNQLPSDEAGRWQHILQQKAQQGASIGPGVTSGTNIVISDMNFIYNC